MEWNTVERAIETKIDTRTDFFLLLMSEMDHGPKGHWKGEGHQGNQDRKRDLGVYVTVQTTKSLNTRAFFPSSSSFFFFLGGGWGAPPLRFWSRNP